MESDLDTFLEHFEEITDGIKDLADLAQKLGMDEVRTVLYTLAATQHMGDIRHVRELAALCRAFAKQKRAWLETRKEPKT